MIHSIWTFLSDTTICGEPIEKEHKSGSPYEHDYVIRNIALELDGITCPICRKEKEHAQSSVARAV